MNNLEANAFIKTLKDLADHTQEEIEASAPDIISSIITDPNAHENMHTKHGTLYTYVLDRLIIWENAKTFYKGVM